MHEYEGLHDFILRLSVDIISLRTNPLAALDQGPKHQEAGKIALAMVIKS